MYEYSSFANALANYTAYALIAGMFILLLRWILSYFKDTRQEYMKLLNESADRERTFQEIIAKLSGELPEIKATLDRIERKMKGEQP